MASPQRENRLGDGTHPPEDNIPGAVAERIVDAPEIVDVHDAEEKGPFSSQNRLQPPDEGIARKQAGKPVMFRPALQVPVRQTQPPCQRIGGQSKKSLSSTCCRNNGRKSRRR